MELINEKIDEDQTIRKTKKLLTHDFQRYLNFSGHHRYELSSPIIDPTGVSTHGGINHTENKLVNGTEAGNNVDAINDCLIDCTNRADAPYASLLYYKYVKLLPTNKIQHLLGYEDAQYYRQHKRALLEFAQRMDHWRKVDHADIPDLVVWDIPEQMS